MSDWPKDPIWNRRLRLILTAWLAALVAVESVVYFFVDRAIVYLVLLLISAVGVVVNGVFVARGRT